MPRSASTILSKSIKQLPSATIMSSRISKILFVTLAITWTLANPAPVAEADPTITSPPIVPSDLGYLGIAGTSPWKRSFLEVLEGEFMRLAGRQAVQTCAFLAANPEYPLYCSPGYQCAKNTVAAWAGCCPDGALSTCTAALTGCVPYSQMPNCASSCVYNTLLTKWCAVSLQTLEYHRLTQI